MTKDELISLARNAALDAGLDRALVCAVVEQESGWDTWAIRYESAFYHRYVEPQNLPATEAHARSFSWGLMQVMGQVARELGFTGPVVSLCDPANGLQMGCKKLRQCLDQSGGDFTQALQRYNGGSNLAYSSQVLARMKNYQL